MMSEQNLVIAAVAAIVIVSLFTKLRIMPKKYFQILFNAIFFVYVYACFQYNYMGIMKAGAALYGSVILVCWGIEVMSKRGAEKTLIKNYSC